MCLIYEIANTLATLFQRSFTDKVDALCHNRSQQPADDMTTEVTARFFEPALPSNVKRKVLASAVKLCELDPLPTSLLKCHIDSLSPVLAHISNAPLSSAMVPPSMKHTVVTPILKKRGSDINVLTNYRPISSHHLSSRLWRRQLSASLLNNCNTSWMRLVFTEFTRVHNVHTIVPRQCFCVSIMTPSTTPYCSDDCVATDYVATYMHG